MSPLRLYDQARPTNEDFDRYNYPTDDTRPGSFCPNLSTLDYSTPDGVESPDGTWAIEYRTKAGTVVQQMTSFLWQTYQRVFKSDGTSEISCNGFARLSAAELAHLLAEAQEGRYPEFITEQARMRLNALLASDTVLPEAPSHRTPTAAHTVTTHA